MRLFWLNEGNKTRIWIWNLPGNMSRVAPTNKQNVGLKPSDRVEDWALLLWTKTSLFHSQMLSFHMQIKRQGLSEWVRVQSTADADQCPSDIITRITSTVVKRWIWNSTSSRTGKSLSFPCDVQHHTETSSHLHYDPNQLVRLQACLKDIKTWMTQNCLLLNSDKLKLFYLDLSASGRNCLVI